MRLTARQHDELERLAGGPQETHGRWRARVQGSLRARGLARLTRDGEPFRPSVVEILISAQSGYVGTMCEITDAGRAALEGTLP